jgi:small-conductance mechanosensitive channel
VTSTGGIGASLDLQAQADALRRSSAISFTSINLANISFIDLGVSLAATLASVALFFVVRAGLRRVLGEPKEGSLHLRKLAARLVAHTHALFLIAAGCAAFAAWLPEPAALAQLFRLLFTVAAVVQSAEWLRELLMALIERHASRHQGDESAFASAVGILSWLVNLVVWSVALLVILDNLGVNVTALVAGFGIGGIAVGLAAQSIIADIFSAISILLDRPFVRGDFIVFGDTQGEVEKIGLKTTRIRALSGEQIIVSNGKLLSELIHNHRRMTERRVLFTIDVGLDTPGDKVERIPAMLRDAVTSNQQIRFDRAHLIGFGDNALKFEVVYFVPGRDYNAYMDIHQAILFAIMKRFDREGLLLARQPRTVRIVGGDAQRDGARPPTAAAEPARGATIARADTT